MKEKTPHELDRITDIVLAYRPKEKCVASKRRAKRRTAKKAAKSK